MKSIAELRNYVSGLQIDDTEQRMRTGVRFEAPKYRPPMRETAQKVSALRLYAKHMGQGHPRVEAARVKIVAKRRYEEQAKTLNLALRVNDIIQHRPHGLVSVPLATTSSRMTRDFSRVVGMFNDARRRG